MILNNIKLKYIGHLFVFISLYFIARSLITLNIDASTFYSYFTTKNIVLASISLFLYTIALYIGALLWIFLLSELSKNLKLPTKSLVKIYSKSNLGKYLPGNVMHYVARNVLAKKHSLSHKIIAAASFIEVAFILISGALLLITVTFLPVINVNIDSYGQYFSYKYILSALCILVVSIALLYIFRNKLSLDLNNIKSSIPGLSVLFRALSGYIFIYLLLGISQLIIMAIFDDIEFTAYNYWNILYVFIFSWIIGFIVPGAPGGIGIREAIFIFLLSQNFPEQAVILVAISYRLINIMGDILFYLLTNKSLRLALPKLQH